MKKTGKQLGEIVLNSTNGGVVYRVGKPKNVLISFMTPTESSSVLFQWGICSDCLQELQINFQKTKRERL